MNQTFKPSGPCEYTSEETPEQTLAEARTRGLELLGKGDMMLRSCWVCNSAHVHLIHEKEAVLSCFGCGHFYLGGVDLTQVDA